MGKSKSVARPRIKAWAQRESESEEDLSSASASEDDEYVTTSAPRKGPNTTVVIARSARSRSVRSSGNLGTPAGLFPSSPSTAPSTVASPLLHDDKSTSPFATLSPKNIKSFLKAGIPLLDDRLVNRKAYNTDKVSWWPTEVRFVDPVFLSKQDQALVCEAIIAAVGLQELERFAMVSCSVLTKDALPVVQEVLQSAREDKQLLYTPESPVSPAAFKIDPESLLVKPATKRSCSTATLDSAPPPPAKSMRLSPSLIPLPIAASPLSPTGEPLVEPKSSGVEISLLQAEEKITSRGRQFQLRPGFAPSTASSCLEMGSLGSCRRREQLQNQLQNQSVGRHRQFSHHPLSLPSQSIPIPTISSPPLHIDNSLGLATTDNDIYSCTSDSATQPFPPQLLWQDSFQYTGPLPLGSFVTPKSVAYEAYIPGNFDFDKIPQQSTSAGGAFLGWLEN